MSFGPHLTESQTALSARDRNIQPHSEPSVVETWNRPLENAQTFRLLADTPSEWDDATEYKNAVSRAVGPSRVPSDLSLLSESRLTQEELNKVWIEFYSKKNATLMKEPSPGVREARPFRSAESRTPKRGFLNFFRALWQ